MINGFGGTSGGGWSDEALAVANGHMTAIEFYVNKQVAIYSIRAK